MEERQRREKHDECTESSESVKRQREREREREREKVMLQEVTV